MLEKTELIQNRYNKLASLREKNINPFVNRFIPGCYSTDVLQNADTWIASEEKLTVSGRILTIRTFGKAAFFHIQDSKGKIQIFIKKGELPDDQFDLFRDFIDSGDIVGIEGIVFRTKTGETTILARQLILLTKSVRPLPEKWHGLRDTDTRYRQRYVDLIVNLETRKSFELRSKIISSCRRYLDGKGYMEVETPMMQPIPGGALAKPFVTFHNALGIPLYLRIAPELYLKRLVVGGFDKIYEINRNFRNEGLSVRHNPEFTMLELYTAGWDYRDTAALVEDMIKSIVREVLGTTKITYQGDEIDLNPPGGWKRMTMLEAIKSITGLELSWGESLESVVGKVKGNLHESEGALKDKTTAELILALFEEKVEPTLIQPTFIMEFPKEKSPLAKSKPGDPLVAERFEFFVGKLETANAYSELNDPEEQLTLFEEQARRREKGDQEAMCIDEDYIRALEYGMPPASGLGVGMDRLTMLCTDASSIRDAILFPILRPETGRTKEEQDIE
ncbi:lysine--tRNA ligase [Candidatus Sumerlaeota bacterium]|nr:lysine--tRNA ligase [Candidatus Sumerlaeota bacterium]